jgi:hypothetical protein
MRRGSVWIGRSMVLTALAVAALAQGCSGSTPSSIPPGECLTDSDCATGEACVGKVCTVLGPAPGPDAGAPIEAGPDVAPGVDASCPNVTCGSACCAAGQTCESGACTTPSSCATPGESCSSSTPCCQTGSNEPSGAACISNDGLCHAKCTSGSECESGCCATVQGESWGVCAVASECTCVAPGGSCASTTQCCQGGAGAVCISNDNACHAKCTANSQCASGCCVQVQGEAWGVCAAASNC